MIDPTKPTYYLQAWDANSNPKYQEFTYQEFHYWKRALKDVLIYDFNGKSARVFVMTASYELTREIALRIANGYIQGKFIRVTFDLKELTVTTSEGTIPTHPPY